MKPEESVKADELFKNLDRVHERAYMEQPERLSEGLFLIEEEIQKQSTAQYIGERTESIDMTASLEKLLEERRISGLLELPSELPPLESSAEQVDKKKKRKHKKE